MLTQIIYEKSVKIEINTKFLSKHYKYGHKTFFLKNFIINNKYIYFKFYYFYAIFKI